MDHNDKFFRIASCCAFVITTIVFALVHVGGNQGQRRQRPSAQAPAATPAVQVAPVPRADLEPDPSVREARLDADDAGIRPAGGSAAGFVRTGLTEQETPAAGASRSVRRLVAELDRLAEGDEPRQELLELPTPADILVRRDSDGRLVVANGTHGRYQLFVDSVMAVDAEEMAAAYRSLGPAMETAYRDMSLSGGSFADRLAEAFDHLLAVEAPQVSPLMVSRGTYWGFADPELAALSPMQQHLLLMGRRNARLVQAKLFQLREALALPEPPATSGVTTADLEAPPPADDPAVVAEKGPVSSAETAVPDAARLAGESESSTAEPVAAP